MPHKRLFLLMNTVQLSTKAATEVLVDLPNPSVNSRRRWRDVRLHEACFRYNGVVFEEPTYAEIAW